MNGSPSGIPRLQPWEDVKSIKSDSASTSTDSNDESSALIAAWREGQGDALDKLLHISYPRLFQLCRRIVGAVDADDAIQEALIAIVRGLPNFDGRSTFATWAYRVTTNSCLNEIRKQKRRHGIHLVRSAGSAEVSVSNDVGDSIDLQTSSAIDSVVDRLDLDEALGALPLDQRVVVVLRDICSLSYDEIAEVLDIAPGTVRSRISRGRTQLHQIISGNSATPGKRQSSSDDK